MPPLSEKRTTTIPPPPESAKAKDFEPVAPPKSAISDVPPPNLALKSNKDEAPKDVEISKAMPDQSVWDTNFAR